MNASVTDSRFPLLLLFSHDKRLAQTRHWVLEQAGFHVQTVHSLIDLYSLAEQSTVAAFLLCNSLPAELRAEAIQLIREHWNEAKLLIFVPPYVVPDFEADEFFLALEGPERLVDTVRHLVPVA